MSTKGKDRHSEYNKMLARFEIDAAIAESEKEITDGTGLIDAREAQSALRVKHLG